jgi:hypothetical protein
MYDLKPSDVGTTMLIASCKRALPTNINEMKRFAWLPTTRGACAHHEWFVLLKSASAKEERESERFN